MDGNTTEAQRWLTIAEKLLASRDLHGTRTFAIRARESAPILAEQILAVTDTLLTAQSNPQDWYAILQLIPLTQSMEVVASQHRKLALLLNPGKNTLPFADQAFRFVSEAWNVLSNPSKKAIYDNELRFLQFGQVSQLGQQQQHHHQQPQLQQAQSQTLFMQTPPPPPPKETQALFMQTPYKETQILQPLFVRRSPRNNSKDGNAILEGGGQLGLNNNPPESTRPAESNWTRQINQIGLAGPSQINQTGSVGSSHISRPEPTRTGQVNRPEPIRASQINQTGTASSSQFDRTEPSRTGQINQTANPPPPPPPPTTAAAGEQSRTEPTGVTEKIDSTRPSQATETEGPTFWTACPYCYVLYEYPKVYEDCTLRCQTKDCRRAFHAVVIPSPPVNGKDAYFCCWGFFPLGFSGNGKNMGGNFPNWSPISTMFACPNNKNAGKQKNTKKPAPRVYYDEHDAYVEISDSSGSSVDDDDDVEWQNESRKKKAKNAKGKGSVGRNAKKPQIERMKKGSNEQVGRGGNLNGVSMVPEGVPTAESSRRGVANSGRKQMGRGTKDLGKLDLNVEFSNEVEEPVPGRSERNHAGYEDEDNIEGNNFFEGLDEFLSSLPILSVVGDDKVKAT